MYHIGVWWQCAARAKISLCQLVNKWESEDDGQIRVLISFRQLWIPAELKVNIWGFSRCLESMDWLVLAAPLSVFVGRPGPISNVSQLHLSSYLDKTTILYIILHSSLTLLPASLSSSFLFLPSPSPSSLHWSRYVTVWALSRLVRHGVSYLWRLRKCLLRETSEGGLLFMITWKTIVCWYWLEDLQSPFRNRRSQRLSNGKHLFWLEIREHIYRGKAQKVKVCLFSIGHLFTAIFKVVHYWLHLYFSLQRSRQNIL